MHNVMYFKCLEIWTFLNCIKNKEQIQNYNIKNFLSLNKIAINSILVFILLSIFFFFF